MSIVRVPSQSARRPRNPTNPTVSEIGADIILSSSPPTVPFRRRRRDRGANCWPHERHRSGIPFGGREGGREGGRQKPRRAFCSLEAGAKNCDENGVRPNLRLEAEAAMIAHWLHPKVHIRPRNPPSSGKRRPANTKQFSQRFRCIERL